MIKGPTTASPRVVEATAAFGRPAPRTCIHPEQLRPFTAHRPAARPVGLPSLGCRPRAHLPVVAALRNIDW